MSPRLVVPLLALVLADCCPSEICPKSSAPVAARDAWEADLLTRKELIQDRSSPIQPKVDVKRFFVNVDAAELAKAFHDVMKDPERHFGLIQVNRLRARERKDFVIGEKFAGRYAFAGAAPQIAWAFNQRAQCGIENDRLLDYGMITKLDMSPAPGNAYELQYVYLEGSPIAGSSTFTIWQIGPKQSTLVQTFEYQEQTALDERLFRVTALHLHNQVVFSQVCQSAEKARGKVLCTDTEPQDQLPPPQCSACPLPP